MRFRSVVFALLFCASMAIFVLGFTEAQAPARPAAKAKTASAAATAAPKVYANLAQLMRGIMFPNSNVVFFAQSKDPAAVKAEGDPALSTDPLSDTYGGWGAVENSALALSESANLLTIPGRVCLNGAPVPIKNADWMKFVQGLRDAGMTAYKAAQSKNQDNMLDAADAVTEACANCHNKYRDVPGGAPDRCK